MGVDRRTRCLAGRPQRSSPRAWGWTQGGSFDDTRHDGVPTRVGVDRWRRRRYRRARWRPHARGGGPISRSPRDPRMVASPRAWGWTVVGKRRIGDGRGVPTRVGVDRLPPPRGGCGSRRPHARGGGPSTRAGITVSRMASPRAWGWTGCQPVTRACCDGVPTRVGVDRLWLPWYSASARRPHARGGGPWQHILWQEKPNRLVLRMVNRRQVRADHFDETPGGAARGHRRRRAARTPRRAGRAQDGVARLLAWPPPLGIPPRMGDLARGGMDREPQAGATALA